MSNEMSRKSKEINQIGNTNFCVPRLGIGCSPFGEMFEKVSVSQSIKALEKAVNEYGISYFDTAPYYGNGCSEARVGISINSIRSAKLIDVQLSTKVGKILDPLPKEQDVLTWVGGYDLKLRRDYSYTGIMQSHRESCLRLGIPSVDALVIHDLDNFHCGNEKESYLRQLLDPWTGGLKALYDLKQSGQIKAIGIGCNGSETGSIEVCKLVSNAAKELEKICNRKYKALDYILCAGPYNLLNHDTGHNDLLPFCKERNLSLVIGAPYGGVGAILAKGIRNCSPQEKADLKFLYAPTSGSVVQKLEELEEVCEQFKVSLGAAALQFPFRNPLVKCVLAGVKSAAEVDKAVQWMDEIIPEMFWNELVAKGLIV